MKVTTMTAAQFNTALQKDPTDTSNLPPELEAGAKQARADLLSGGNTPDIRVERINANSQPFRFTLR